MRRFALASLLFVWPSAPASGYSVLTHKASVDASWDRELKPLLLKRFPDATDEQLRDAHAYAYGGAIIQDMGYYPFGSHFFSDLVHYARSGDFVVALVRDARDVNEYAFALGAGAHLNLPLHSQGRTVPGPGLRSAAGKRRELVSHQPGGHHPALSRTSTDSGPGPAATAE